MQQAVGVRMGGGLAFLAAVSLAAWCGAATPEAITTASLLADMTDLAAMAEFPDPPYTCQQFSSYDRAAKSPTEDWFANGDCGQYLRVEDKDGRKEHVMMDAEGPGAIVRIWSANPNGTLRIYLDGADKPVLEAKMTDLLGGKFPGLPKPIACEVSRGWNLYFPIPYAKSCKVTSDAGGFYYHVNYRTYPAGTKVVSFAADQLKDLEGRVAKLAERLAAPWGDQEEIKGTSKTVDATIEPGKSLSVGKLSGPGAIAALAANVAADDKEAALRGLVLRITFDGDRAVEVPLGDFFGAAPGVNPYESVPLLVLANGEMWCRWFMPYEKSAELEVANLGKQAVKVKLAATAVPYKWTDRSMRFYAKWRAVFDFPTRPMVDWNYLTAKGKGVFAGVSFAIDNPVKDWWGEGDEKIYFDGQTFPSHFGTGTEDYYGYAWCCNEKFVHAYHNQPRCDGPGNYGRTSVNRFHVIDRIPFQKDFRFDMELWHWKECKVNMAVTAYWYARPGATDAFKPVQAADVELRPVPEIVVPRVKGAIEGEKMRIVEKTGNPAPQEWEGVSGGAHLWWHDGQKPGDKLVLAFDVEKAGKYRVEAQFLKAVDYGIIQLEINGRKVGDPIDFFNDGVALTGPVDLGTFEFKQGENRLTATVVGANEKAVKAYMFGLDYLLLKPAE